MVSVSFQVSVALQILPSGSRLAKAKKPKEKIKTGCDRNGHQLNSLELSEVYAPKSFEAREKWENQSTAKGTSQQTCKIFSARLPIFP
ncbi:MAG: hypothetical protein C0619_07430 [Desulfuromonas sp.]|nr:MAG: hypothetical protein C0619_07430 [Desulfuromonas sp.]